MNLINAFHDEIANEAKSTRKLLERVPEDKFQWKPHAKSMSLAQLASHVADGLSWVDLALKQAELEIDPASHKPWLAANRVELVKKFDANVEQALKMLKSHSDADLAEQWMLKVGGKVILQMPKGAVIRGVILNHFIHHRGQLSVYLRLLDVPLPSIYGPSADEH